MSTLIKPSILFDEAIKFDDIQANEFISSLEESIKTAKKKIEEIKKIDAPTFDNTVIELDDLTESVDRISLVFSNLDSAHCTDELSSISEKFYSLVTKFNNELAMDKDLFEKIQAIWSDKEKLDKEEKKVIENSYKSMVRNGALLNDNDKENLKKIDLRLSELSVKFSENSRNAVNDFSYVVESLEDLKGLPNAVLEAAKEKAKDLGKEGKYAFGLDFSSFYPVLQYCENRKIRKDLYMANATKAYGGKFDNQDIILEILQLRYKRAKLLGFETHADYILEERMAKNPKAVFDFIEDLYEKAAPKALDELKSLKSLKKEISKDEDYQKWDHAFYSEKLKNRELDLDDEALRPYFKLENVVKGVFETASRLYDLNFEEIDLPTYHKDVSVYKVSSNDEYIGLFYCDFFPRKEKRAGAWMTEYRSQGLYSGKVRRPHISIVCNFTKPTKSKPSLLSLNEVLTLFHEFGHALHGLLSNVKYRSIAGPSVYWDFVELPSQIFENWVLEKECITSFAKHYETGESLPNHFIEKIKKTNRFLSGLATLRQLSFAYLDMKYHSIAPGEIESIASFENTQTQKFDLLPKVEGTNFSCSFGHIFAGGYSAGYYSYKWAEVLDADAFKHFKENGIFNKKIANSFKDNILSKGGSEHPMELYKKFRGTAPTADALIERAGL